MAIDLPYQLLLEAAPDGIIVCDQHSTILLVNKQVEHMFGYTRDELLGQKIDRLVPDTARARHQHHVSGFVSAPRLRPMGSGLELHGRRKDGTELPVEISLSPTRASDGTVMITAGIRDVSDRRRLERDAKRATAYLTSAVDAVQDAFALFDEQDRVVMVNSTARHLLGSALDRPIVGLRFDELLDVALGKGVFDFSNESRDALYQRWMSYHRDPAGTLEVRTGTGRYLRVKEHRTAEHGTVAVIADVTDDVERADELKHAREVAEAASAAKSEFLSSMSHELRTPLNAVLGFAQLLERDRKQPLSERQLERLGHVLRGGEHLLRLIDDVLDLSRIEAGRISISSEPVGVPEVLREVVTTLEPMAARSQIAIAAPELPELPAVQADRTRLAQILMNFGSNAIKYGKQGGHVAFAVESHARYLRITVIDDGIGIPADKRDKVFEPFQRAGQEAGPIEGTGIGLTISKRLAGLMKGAVGFDSVEGQGSRFWVDIPIHREASIGLAEARTTLPGASPLARGDRRYVIVYVEDNPSNIAFMRDLLADFASVELMTAPTAEIGIELIRTHQPTLVIMDINLPGMSGFEAVRRLREWPETAGIPVIGLSAAALARDIATAKETGFYRYLTKPVKVDELMATLEQLLPA